MSELFFKCPQCAQEIEAPDDLTGMMLNCPTCAKIIQVPGESDRPDVIESFPCPQCGWTIEISTRAAGLLLDCPNCKQTIQVPEAPPDTPVEEPPAEPVEPAAPAAPVAPAASRPPSTIRDDTRLQEDVEEQKKGSTSRIDIPTDSGNPRPQMRTVTIKRSGVAGPGPHGHHGEPPPPGFGSAHKKTGGFFGRH